MSVIYTTLVRITIDTVSGTSQTAATYLFSEIDKPLHIQNPTTALPYLGKNIQLGQEIKENITASGRTTLVFRDDANATGTYFWRQWVSKNPFYKNRIVEILSGTAGIPESSYSVVFKGVIENIRFKNDETVEIVIKTLLQLCNKQYPRPTDGKLQGTIASGEVLTGITMQPGTGLDPFSASGHQYKELAGNIRIGNEIIGYSTVTDISGGQKTQFKFNTQINRGFFTADGWDSNAASHQDGDDIIQVDGFNDSTPIDIMEVLLDKAGITASDLETQSFTDVKNDPSIIGRKVRTIFGEPAEIKTYLQELRELTFTTLFQNENNKIEINLLTPATIGQSFKKITDNAGIIFKSFSVDQNQTGRITRVVFNYDQQPDGKTLRTVTFVDSDRELKYLEQKPKKFVSRWLRSDLGGEAFASQTAQSIIRVFGDGKTFVEFDVSAKDSDLKLGEVFKLSTNQIQTAIGGPLVDGLFQVVKKHQVADNRWRYKAFDTRLNKRFGFYSRDSIPDYISAGSEDRLYGFYSDNNDKMSNGDGGYLYV